MSNSGVSSRGAAMMAHLNDTRVLQPQLSSPVVVGAGQHATIFTATGPGILVELKLSANPYAAYIIRDTFQGNTPILSTLYNVPGGAPNVTTPAGALQPTIEVQLLVSTVQLTYSGLTANTIYTANTSAWSASFTTSAGGSVTLEYFTFYPPVPLQFYGTLSVSVVGIFNGNTVVRGHMLTASTPGGLVP
ncbi:MAG: hypothetical protein QW688_07315 [Thermoprotei archaeon]